MQQISQNWNSMKPDMRKKYEEMARLDLERYNREKVLFLQEFSKQQAGSEEDKTLKIESSDDERSVVQKKRYAKKRDRGQMQQGSNGDKCNKPFVPNIWRKNIFSDLLKYLQQGESHTSK